MATRIYWTPPDVPATTYEVASADNNTLPLALAAVVVDARPGPNWDPAKQQFFYDDPTGTDRTVYRVQAFDGVGLVGDTGIFQPPTSFAANLATRQKVDHNFGGVDALAYEAPGGARIPQAVVRCFKKADFDAGRTDLALYATETDANGRFVSPFFLEVGLDYVLTYEKRGSFGPDKKVLTV